MGGRVPGAEAPCFSVAGIARTEVRAYLRSKSDDGGSVLRGCGGAVLVVHSHRAYAEAVALFEKIR
jgi:hypothetical protein